MEQNRVGLIPHRDHRRHIGIQRERRVSFAQDQRLSRTKRHRQMDRHRIARLRHPIDFDWRVRVRSLPVLSVRRKSKGQRNTERSRQRQVRRRQGRLRRGHPQGPVRLENHILCPGLHAVEGGCHAVQLGPQLWRLRADVARRLYHSFPLLGQHQRGLRKEPRLAELAARRVLHKRDPQVSGGLARGVLIYGLRDEDFIFL